MIEDSVERGAAPSQARADADIVGAIEARGHATVAALLSGAQVEVLRAALARAGAAGAVRRRGETYAIRGLFDAAREVRRLVLEAAPVHALAAALLGSEAAIVRATLFDKTPSANWGVAWHQDVTIEVAARHDAPGFGPWSTRAGVLRVQPPTEVLARMLSIRLHLDNCDAENGALRVVPGSHRAGRLAPDAEGRLAREGPVETCAVPAGGAHLVRPLLLHASSPARSPRPRRVIHLDLAAVDLPAPLEWRMRVRVPETGLRR